MQMVRIGLGGKDLIVDVDNQWRSNQDQPHVMIFELYTKHGHSCDEMISDAKNNTQNFLSSIKPYFEFTMVVGQNEARNFNLTGKTLQKSAFFSELVNKHADKNGIVYLQSKDLNRLTRNVYNKFEIDELVSAAYIPSAQEKEIINELLKVFKDQQIQSKDLTKDEWNSVFWDDIFARPDIQTDYANEVFKYDKEEKKFKYDSEKDRQFRQKIENMHHKNSQNSDSANAGFNFFGLFGGNGGIESTEVNDETKHSIQDAETMNRDALSFDDFNKVIKKENVYFKWTGMKFESKDLTLFRLNTRNLNISNEIYFKRIVVTEYQTTQKIEIKSASASGFIESYIDPNLRYSFQSKKLSFIDAEKYCFKKNGHLINVNSMFENMFLIEEATSAYNNSTSETFWIGATDTIKAQAWSWVDNSPFIFNNCVVTTV
uniref:C-type lectin domain-containing protein n=1 Tax=Panagrolaimus davidi TaxID=227884 RepID=A0A914QZU5_9BILA